MGAQQDNGKCQEIQDPFFLADLVQKLSCRFLHFRTKRTTVYGDPINFESPPLDYSTQTIDDLVKIKDCLFRLNECRLQRSQADRCGSLVLRLFVRSNAGNLKTGPITSEFLVGIETVIYQVPYGTSRQYLILS